MKFRSVAAAVAAVTAQATDPTPTCDSVGHDSLCQTSCASSCRGFPPGFAVAGCADEVDCTNPPSWAAGSVCECGSAPGPSSSPSPSPSPSTSPAPASSDGMVGGYLLLKDIDELNVLAENAKTIPFTRIYLAFLLPSLTYEAGSKTLSNTGLDKFEWGDVYNATEQLIEGGVEVFLSMGGWNAGCFPYFYARYSVAGYGSHTPNFWEIQQYGQGDIDNCVESNQFCYVCEPPSENTTLADFDMFPEPKGHDTWEAAKSFIESNAGDPAPIWSEDMVPGKQYTDSKTGISVLVPGSDSGLAAGRNPYQDIVYLAKDLGVTGIDLDYEEMWHADYYKTDAPAAAPTDPLFRLDKRPMDHFGNYTGPWNLHQTVYKYSAIAKDIQSNIETIAPNLKFGTAAAAVGAWVGDWWGGNLKGLWAEANQKFPEIIKDTEVNVMTYDLSADEDFHECPDDQDCPLDKQVAYYMNTFKTANIAASVGYEIGTPAYPSPIHDKQNQLPLTKDMLASIIATTQSQHNGGFIWEIFKDVADPTQATPQDVAQAICNSVRSGDSRCSGTIPAKPSKSKPRHAGTK